jgi:hypothetical protein
VVDDAYPEALYYKGLIILKGSQPSGHAAKYLERYIQEASCGSHRDDAERLLASIR